MLMTPHLFSRLFSRLSPLALLLGFGASLLPQRASAQLAVDRASVTFAVGDSGSRVAELIVRNTSAGEVEATLWLDAAHRSEIASSATADRTERIVSCRSRLRLSPASIRVGPGEVRTVRVSVVGDAPFLTDCWSTAVLLPTKVVSRPFSTEPTIIRRTRVPLHVDATGSSADVGTAPGTRIAAPSGTR